MMTMTRKRTTTMAKEEVIRYWHLWGQTCWSSFGRAAKKEEGGCKGKGGSNGPRRWKLCAIIHHGTLWEDKVDDKNGCGGSGDEKNENKEEEDKEGGKEYKKKDYAPLTYTPWNS